MNLITKRITIDLLVVTFTLLINASYCFGISSQDRLKNIIHFIIEENNNINISGLKKSIQGQIPVNMAPGIHAYENMEGISEDIKQEWEDSNNDSIYYWKNTYKTTYTLNGHGDFSHLFTYYEKDSTWKLLGESILEYHTKGKISSETGINYVSSSKPETTLTKFEYNQFDSVISFYETNTRYGGNLIIKGTVSYGSNNKMDTIKVTQSYYENKEETILTYTYFPDGKLDTEEMFSNSSIKAQTIHSYPNTLSEITLSWRKDKYGEWKKADSVIVSYNNAGLITNTLFYESCSYYYGNDSTCTWYINGKTTTTYDERNRPLMNVTMVPTPTGGWVNYKRTLFSYDNVHITTPINKTNKVILAGTFLTDKNTILLTVTLKGNTQTIVELYNLQGSLVQQTVVNPLNNAIQLQLNKCIVDGCYTCLIKQNGQINSLKLMKY